MKTRNSASFSNSSPCVFRRLLSFQAAFLCLAMALMLSCQAHGQSVPAEDYGPFNATFLPDGSPHPSRVLQRELSLLLPGEERTITVDFPVGQDKVTIGTPGLESGDSDGCSRVTLRIS